jgi:hypothetical protein
LRGIDFQLQGGLVNLEPEVGEEVTHGLLAVLQDLPGGRVVDGVGDSTTEFLEALAEGGGEGLGSDRGQRVHADLRKGEGSRKRRGARGTAA